MVQDVQQSHYMFLLAAIEFSFTNIVDDHVPDFFAAML
jgi:hypothetical protein